MTYIKSGFRKTYKKIFMCIEKCSAKKIKSSTEKKIS